MPPGRALILASCQHIDIQSQQARYYNNVQKRYSSVFFVLHKVSVPLTHSFSNIIETFQQKLTQGLKLFKFNLWILVMPQEVFYITTSNHLQSYSNEDVLIIPRWCKKISNLSIFVSDLEDAELIKPLFHILYFL